MSLVVSLDGVARLRVVGDEVAGLEFELFEEEGVRACEAARRVAAQVLEIDLLLRAAVDGEEHLDRPRRRSRPRRAPA